MVVFFYTLLFALFLNEINVALGSPFATLMKPSKGLPSTFEIEVLEQSSKYDTDPITIACVSEKE